MYGEPQHRSLIIMFVQSIFHSLFSSAQAIPTFSKGKTFKLKKVFLLSFSSENIIFIFMRGSEKFLRDLYYHIYITYTIEFDLLECTYTDF